MITDDKGNKLPESRIKKKDWSRVLRERRMNQDYERNLAFCNECGYRKRGGNHMEGQHHKRGKVTE